MADWNNLFLTCVACNRAKGNQWSEGLLRPDEPGFSFDRYFMYRQRSGEILPNIASPPGDQERARRTIHVLRLNRPAACDNRQIWTKVINKYGSEDLGDRTSYRFLVPLFGAATSKA